MPKTPSGIKYSTNFPRPKKEKIVDFEFGVKGGARPNPNNLKKKSGRKK